MSIIKYSQVRALSIMADIAKKILDGDESTAWYLSPKYRMFQQSSYHRGLFKYDKELKCIAHGANGAEELKSNLKDDAVLFGYIRLHLGSDRRKKYAILKWVGDDVRALQRARAFEEGQKVTSALKIYHIELPIARKSDLTDTLLMERVKAAAGANYDKEQNSNTETISSSNHEFGNYKRTSKEFFQSMEQKGNLGGVVYDTKPMARSTPVDLGNRQMTAGASAARANTVNLQIRKEQEQKV